MLSTQVSWRAGRLSCKLIQSKSDPIRKPHVLEKKKRGVSVYLFIFVSWRLWVSLRLQKDVSQTVKNKKLQYNDHFVSCDHAMSCDCIFSHHGSRGGNVGQLVRPPFWSRNIPITIWWIAVKTCADICGLQRILNSFFFLLAPPRVSHLWFSV